MRGALSDGRSAARLVADHADLWLPGAVGWLSTVGWAPFLLAVASLPGSDDMAFFGSGLAASGTWPFNVVAIASAGLVLVVGLLAALAVSETALWFALRAWAGGAKASRAGAPVLRLLGVELVAGVPVALAIALLAVGFAAVGPDEFQSPDIGGDLGARILGRVLPLLVIALAALLVSQATGAAAGRRAVLLRQPIARALSGGVGDLRRAGGGTGTVAIGSLAASAAYVVGVWLLLRVLWAPVGLQLATESGIDIGVGLLLVGFVAIWLCLVLGGGAIHAWASAWWTLVLADTAVRPAVPAPTREESQAE